MFPHVSSTLLSILADLDNAVIWMVSTCPLIFKSCNHFNKPFGIIQSALTTISITVSFMFHNFFSSLERSMLGITHLSPYNKLVHLPYIAVATNTRAD